MIEREAVKMRCCGPEGCGQSVGNDNEGSPTRYCIASACMGWRKSGEARVEDRQKRLVERDIDGTGRWHYDGYCGLAGKP